jgi:hypothetical protein
MPAEIIDVMATVRSARAVILALELERGPMSPLDMVDALTIEPIVTRVQAAEIVNRIQLEDAQRFRALLRCGRIRMFGVANVDSENGEFKDPNDWVHFGAEFWSIYPQGTLKEDPENKHDLNRWGNLALMALADHVLHVEREKQRG